MKYIIINGIKYKIDPNDSTKALLNDKGEPVPYEEEEKDKDKDKPVDLSKVSLEDLKKANPEVAKLISNVDDMKAQLDKINNSREDEEKKKKQEAGKFQELFEEEQAKRKEAESKANKADEILGKYKSTVNGILETTLKGIPEDRHALIPNDYSPRKKLEYINNNSKLLGVTIGGKGSPIPKNDDDIKLDEESKVQKEYDELLKKGKDRTQMETNKMLELSKKIKEIRTANQNKK